MVTAPPCSIRSPRTDVGPDPEPVSHDDPAEPTTAAGDAPTEPERRRSAPRTGLYLV